MQKQTFFLLEVEIIIYNYTKILGCYTKILWIKIMG